MKIELHTKGFEKTESMETFIRREIDELLETYLKHERDVHLRIHVDEDRHRVQSRKPHFFCEIQLKTAGSKKLLKSHKTSGDFRFAVNEAVRALKTILQRRSDRRHDLKSDSRMAVKESDKDNSAA